MKGGNLQNRWRAIPPSILLTHAPCSSHQIHSLLSKITGPTLEPPPISPSSISRSTHNSTINMSSLIIKELIKFVKKKFAADKAAKAEGEKKAECERASFPNDTFTTPPSPLPIQNQANLDPFFPPLRPNSKNPCCTRRTRPSPRMDCSSRCQRKPILLRWDGDRQDPMGGTWGNDPTTTGSTKGRGREETRLFEVGQGFPQEIQRWVAALNCLSLLSR